MDEELRQLLRRIRRLEIKTRNDIGDRSAGLYRSRFRGQGMEFDQVREYTAGDDVRHIDWNVTARAGRPYVKTFREERELTILLLVDCSGSMRFGAIPGLSDRTKMATAAEVAATVAITAMRNNDRVGMVGFTDRTEIHHRPKRGRYHAMRLLRDLLAFKAPARRTDVPAALEELRRVHHRRTACFVISDFVEPHPDLGSALQRSRRDHDVIGVRITDPGEEGLPSAFAPLVLDDPEGEGRRVLTGGPRAARTYRRAWERQVAEVLGEFRGAGCDLVDCRTDRPAFPIIRNFFRRRRRRIRG